MPFGGLLTAGLIGGGASIFAGLEGSSAAKTAASQEAQSAANALAFQKEMWGTEQANAAPYLQAGNTSIAQLMSGLNNGQFTSPNFAAPTLEQAQATPGYQFALQQGNKGILQASAATGGAISGGTSKALEQYGTNLANTTYNDVYNRSLQTYQENLAKQAQQYGQLFNTASLGENAAAGLNSTGQSVATNTGNLMTSIGSAQAAGTVGSANAWTQGVSGAVTDISQLMLMSKLLGLTTPKNTVNPTNLNPEFNSAAGYYPVPSAGSISPVTVGLGPG